MSFHACGLGLGAAPWCDRALGHEGECMYGSGESELEQILEDWRARIEEEALEPHQVPPKVRTLLELEEGR